MSSPRVVAIVAAFNEADIIGDVLRALIGEGVSVYFIDDHSTDGTADIAASLRGHGVIGIERFARPSESTAFHWEAILERKAQLATELDADWFVHHDADEFRESPWDGVTLRDAVARVDRAGYNAIDFELLNFHPTVGDAVDRSDVRDRMLFYERAHQWDRLQIKCWKRTAVPIDLVSSGGHEASFQSRQVRPIRFLLRHYPIRSQAHGERKVFLERKPRFLTEEQRRGWHVQYDGIDRDTRFVREPSSLTRFDSEALRWQVQIQSRDLETASAVLEAASSQAAALQQQLDELQRQLEAQTVELNRLRAVEQRLAEIQERSREQEMVIEELRADAADAQERLRGVLGQLSEQGAQIAGRDAQIVERDGQIAELRQHIMVMEQRLTDLLQSRSWRVTAPLRSAQRLVTGK